MRFTLCLLVTTWLFSPFAQATANNDFPTAFQPVIDIFTGLSEGDKEKVKRSVAPDFILLEQGEVWDTDMLLSIVKGPIPRINAYHIISSDIREDLALFNYWTQSNIGKGNNPNVLTWLESVVVVKTNKGWKLQQFHSTRVLPEKVPVKLEFIQAR
ncbi:hypothetical protein [Thalassotalea litorea]|uniref:hypothetical protein n=1 Tax=Thalassotalea litorea TaxID=2020715 RepID=UPI0037362A07